MAGERFEDIVQDQFGVHERALYSSAWTFPLLDPEGRAAALAVQLQLDAAHGTISSVALGQRLEDLGETFDSDFAELAARRLEIFSGFYVHTQQLLQNPGDTPVFSDLQLNGNRWVIRYPGDNASGDKRLQWALHAACRQSFEDVESLENIGSVEKLNLNALIGETLASYLMHPYENFQELVG